MADVNQNSDLFNFDFSEAIPNLQKNLGEFGEDVKSIGGFLKAVNDFNPAERANYINDNYQAFD